MIKIFNNINFNFFIKILLLALVAKFFAFTLWFFLPNNGVSSETSKLYKPAYQRVNFSNMIKDDYMRQIQNSQNQSGITISDMVLRGLYGSKNKGFAILSMKLDLEKTQIIKIGEIFNDYKLKSIQKENARFTKNGLEFVLYYNLTINSIKKNINTTKKQGSQTKPMDVSKNDIDYYAKNHKQIWKEISLTEIKDKEIIKGFRVNRIDKKSRFARLGLKKGDLIIRVNNTDIVSYKNAIDIYKNIDNLDMIQIVVIRNEQEVELIYEIN